MSDLVDRLRNTPWVCNDTLHEEAASEIERLRIQITDALDDEIPECENCGLSLEACEGGCHDIHLRPVRVVSVAEIEAMLDRVAARHGMTLTEFYELGRQNELTDPELRDLWLIWGLAIERRWELAVEGRFPVGE